LKALLNARLPDIRSRDAAVSFQTAVENQVGS
jgi:hypothetical protein